MFTLTILVTSPAQAEQLYSFGNVSANYLVWTHWADELGLTPSDPSLKSDFFYIELEGGSAFDWGDLYGFIDFENPFAGDTEDPTKQFRVAAKGVTDVRISDSQWNLYGHIYSFSDSSGFYEQNLVAGVSYRVLISDRLFLKPFIGPHYAHTNFDSSFFNGYMFGWVMSYQFFIGQQSWSVAQWHETEFARADRYKQINGSVGQNGAISLWWHPEETRLTPGIQYRYAYNKLGTKGYQDGLIFSLKYNF